MQFRLIHLLIAVTVCAILVQPSRLACNWVAEEYFASSPKAMYVNDGGTFLIGGSKRYSTLPLVAGNGSTTSSNGETIRTKQSGLEKTK